MNESVLGKPSLRKKNYGIFHNRSDPTSTFPIKPKLWRILKNINYFMTSKSGLVLKFLNYGIDIAETQPQL